MKITASILDYSYPFLDPAVWDQDQNLYAYQKDFILRMVNKMCETYGLVNSDTWIEDIVIIGSLTTSKWLLTSDLDVHIRVNLEAFKANVLPQATVEQAFEELDTVRKMFDRAKILAPMTQHPIEFYFESISFRPSNTALVGVYSVLQNKWVKEPIMFDADLDFEESKKDVIAQAEALAEELDSSLGKIQRDIQRVDELEAVINAWDSSKQQLFYAKVEQKLKAIEAEILKDIKVKQDLVDARHADQNATSEIEIKFKWLARFGFFGILSNLKTLMEQTGGQVTTQELPLIDKIISQGSIKEAFLKEAFEKETLLIDFDRTLAVEHDKGVIGEPINGAKEALDKLKQQGFDIEIYSVRANDEKGLDEVKEWLDKNNIAYDSIFQGEKPRGTIIDDHAIRFNNNWNEIVKQVEKLDKAASIHITSAIALQTIDPKTFKRKEPYALFIGTGDYGKAGKIDMFNVYGEHPMITESNALPTVTLDTLVQQNIPIIGKEPRAGDKQPFQDISGLYKQAQTKKIKQGSYSCLMALLPHEIAQEIVEFGVRTVPDDKLYLDEDGKLGRELESHITIKYGLLTNDAKHVRRSFNDDKPFHAKLGKVRHFQPPELPFDVLTVEIISDDLVKANKKICDNFDCAEGLVSDEYKPHITIAYMKRDTAEEYIGSDMFEGKEVELDTVIFSPHKGNRTYFSISQDKESSFVLEQINKIASGNNFLPSFFNDTNNEWQFEHGGDDQEIDLNPDSVSDETTWYAPCTEGKPRTKEVWRQFISMFTTPFSKKEDVQIEAVYDKELEEAEKNALGEDQTLLEYSKGFYDPKKHDFPHNTTWDSLTQDGEPSKPTSVTYSPQISNEDNLDQNSPGGYPRRFMGKPKGEWFSNEGEVNNALIDMLKNREAALDSMTRDITADYNHAYWIDPSGKIFEVRGSTGNNVGSEGNKYGPTNTHSRWILDNLDMLEKNYGIDPKNFSGTSGSLIDLGWIRVGDAYGTDWGVTVKSLNNIPSSVDDLLAQFAPEGSKITVETPGAYKDSITFEWPVNSIQKTVQQYRNRRPVMAKKASIEEIDGLPVLVNPTENELKGFSRNLKGGHMFRGLIDPHTGDLFVWDAYEAIHTYVIQKLGLDVKYSDESPFCLYFPPSDIYDALARQQEVKCGDKLRSTGSLDKIAGDQSASVPDYLINEWKTDQLHDDISEEPYVNHDQRDYPYGMHDSPENTAFNIGWAKDNQPYVVRLDILEDPAYRLDPFGIGEYTTTWYTSLPASDGIEQTNPD